MGRVIAESGMRKLGKGLEALLPGPTPAVAPSELGVPVHEIVPNPEQPRRHFEDEALDLLADSIRRHGLLQPLVVRRIAGRYELIAGERRLRAARRAGLERVPVIVREARAEDRLELALIENVQRENLTPLEEAEAYRHLIDAHGLTQEKIAARVGKSRPAITNTLRLLGLPDAVKAQLESGELTAGHARAVLAIEGVAEQVSFAREIVTRRLTKSEAERLVTRRRAPKPGGAIVVGYAAVGAALLLGRSLRDAARTTLAWLLARDGAPAERDRAAGVKGRRGVD